MEATELPAPATAPPAPAPAPPPRAHRTFSSLRVRNFRLFIFGQLVSTTGTWMQLVAGPWVVLQISHSGTMLGLDAALQFVPMMLAGAWGGVIADRYDNRRLQIISQLAYATLSTILFLLVVSGAVQLWMVFVMSFLTGCVSAVDFPTRQSFYLEMVGPDDLTNAMSLNTATFTATRVIGPAIAGLLIGETVRSTAPVFLINAISYLAVVAALLAMRRSELHSREHVPRGKGQVREGLRYVWRTPDLRLPLAVMLGVFLFAFNFPVLMPLLATRVFHGGSRTYAIMLAVVGAGSLTAALVMASRAKRPDLRRLALLAVGLGACSIGLGVAPEPLAWAILPLLGATAIAFAITGNSTLQLTASPSMRGRVMALYSVVFLGSTPIGGPIAGWVGQNLGVQVALAGGGAIAVLVGLAALSALRSRRALPAPAVSG